MKASDLPQIPFVLIPVGTFMMGESWQVCGSFEEKIHQVTITKPFELMTTPVTQALWSEVMGTNPSHFQGRDKPVDSVSWEDTQLFIQKLNAMFGAAIYRLPTEAEWEYACRTPNHPNPALKRPETFGSGAITPFEPRYLKEYAWYNTNSGGFTHPVGQKQPNAWGLYDMLGNVWEWCQDWYAEDISQHVIDPRGPFEGANRVVRGGAWNSDYRNVTASCRGRRHPNLGFSEEGFRLARTPPRDLISDPKPGDVWVNRSYQEVSLSLDMANPVTIQKLIQSGFLIGYVKSSDA